MTIQFSLLAKKIMTVEVSKFLITTKKRFLRNVYKKTKSKHKKIISLQDVQSYS